MPICTRTVYRGGEGIGWVEAAGELTAIVGAQRRVTGASQATQESGQYRSTFALGRRFKDVAVSKEPDLRRPGKREKVG